MAGVYTCNFNLYYPPGRREFARLLGNGMPGAGTIPYRVVQDFIRGITDFGEINPDYTGFAEMSGNIVLHVASSQGKSLGIIVLEPKGDKLARIDITLLKEECRGKGLGSHLYAFLEGALAEGTVLYVEHVTFYGRKFFKKCGFYHDVDLIKELSLTNRINFEAVLENRLLRNCI